MKTTLKFFTTIITLSILFSFVFANIVGQKKTFQKSIPNTENYLVGCDLSHHQGKINWVKSYKELFSYVYIKSSEGNKFKDSEFKNNWFGSKKIGIYRGAYHVYRPEKSAKSQFMNIISVVPKDKQALPIAIDLESLNRVSIENKNNVQKELTVLIRLLKNYYGKDPILYLSNSAYKKFIQGKFENKIWTWHYTQKTEPKKFGDKKWSVWQFAVVGKENIKYKKFTKDFKLDLDYFNGNIEDFKKEMCLN